MLGLTRENLDNAGAWLIGQLTARKAGIAGTISRHTMSGMGLIGLVDIFADRPEGQALLRTIADNFGLLVWSLLLVAVPVFWARVSDWLLELKAPPADPVRAASPAGGTTRSG